MSMISLNMLQSRLEKLPTYLNKERLPNLLAIARDFLAIPALSIASEQMFSYAGHIIDYRRTLLDPDTIVALMCQRNWLNMADKFCWDL
ncbi:13676_t:CDS:2 [Dentiscutata erythropus]|uniref:13676_t:CDS:1 n=1 Tax=Dentiscutata erythropus TaxID=1348616 RepID=A0A9N9NUV6_9GLOM|nr:13676_t:CDS:2 [Dentiscutata erythropus]